LSYESVLHKLLVPPLGYVDEKKHIQKEVCPASVSISYYLQELPENDKQLRNDILILDYVSLEGTHEQSMPKS